MGRMLAATVAAAAGLVAIVGAQAKAPQGGIDVCGASGCSHVAWPDAEQLYVGSLAIPWHAATPAPFFTLHLRWSSTDDQIVYWVPAEDRVRWGGGFATWTHPSAAAEAVLRGATNGLEPFQIQVKRVTVDGPAVRSPQTYLRLFRRAGRTYDNPPAVSWMRVRITSGVESPWSDEAATILLDRKWPFLYVDGTVMKIPPATAQLAWKRLPLR